MSSAAASTEAAFNSFAAVSLKPLLRYIASECVASMTPHDSSIVEFVIKLLSANKEHLENACRIGANRPAQPSASIPAVTAASHVSQERPYINADRAKALESDMARLSGSEKNATKAGKLYEIACDRVDKGFQRRDYHFLHSVYDRFCNGAPDMPTSAVNDALAAAFCFGHNPRSQEELLALLDIDRNGSISRDEFYRAARRAGEVERWLLRLPLASIVSDAISAALTFSSASPEDDPLRQLSALTSEQLQDTMSASLQGLSRCIGEGIASLQQVFEIQDRATLQQQEGLGSKFSVYKMACGTMEDFHKGLSARIGSPNLDFETSMRAEHCAKAGCDVAFTTTNYGIATTPHLEWLYIVGTEQLEEIDALDSSGEWYQAFIVKRTDSGIFVHFEGKAKSCDETIPLDDIPTRVRVRSKKGSIEETSSVVSARHVQLESIDVKTEVEDQGDIWLRGFIIQRSEDGVCVHTSMNNGEVIPHALLSERTRPCSKIGPDRVNLQDLAAHYCSDFSQFVQECDIQDSDGDWHVGFALKRPETPSEILLHYAGRSQDWDETIISSGAAARLRSRSKIGPLGEESPSCVAMAYVERSDKNTEKFEEVDAFDCAGSWYQAFIISKDDRHVLVHFSGWQQRYRESISLSDMGTRIRPRSADTPVGPLGAQSNDDVFLLQQGLNCDSVEEIDALDSSGEWYQAFIVKRTDSGIFVHFEGKAKSCDETIPLDDIPTRVRERARKGHRHMEDLVTLAQMYMFQEVDALDYNKEWYQAFIIKRTDAGALVHYEGKGLSNDEVISLTDLPARVRVRCSANMCTEASEVVVLHYPAVFNLDLKSSDVLSSHGEWLKAWIIEATKNNWLVHYVGKDDRHDEQIPIADLASRTRVESKIGELGPERNDAVFNMYDKTEARLEEIDARDCNGAWYKAFIVARTEANVHVHFSGWDMRWDERIPLEDVPTRVRPREISTATGPLGYEENRIVSAMYTLDGEAAKKRYIRTPCPPKDLINIHRSDMPRVLPDVEALLSCKTAVKAGLTRAEVIALILYTGPMFQVYNCILRRFPQNIYDVYANSDSDPNLFSTTIFVLVSAVQKLSRSNLIPPGTQLYRGMGGLMDLPDCFLQSDENGCCGYVEWGFMSTTTDRGIAVQYSGVKQGRPKATVMVIHPSSVDRGACIVEFSQYPGEKEFLWVPCSLVQPLGDDATSVEVMHGGLVTVLSVRVNINIKTETVEELVAKKKSMHIAAMKAMIDDLGQDLKSISESEAFKERVRKDGSINYSNSAVIVEHIIQQCRLVLQRHEERDALEFVNDKIYRCLVMQLLDCKSWAKEKLQLWLHDNAEYWEGRFGIKKETLVASHRMWLALQRRLIARAASESLAAQASTVLLQSQGLILQNVAEDTFDDEPISRAAGANGWSLENITALKVAGGDLNATYSNGWTSLLYAARYGATSTVSALIECGAHVNARNSQDESAIILASRSGIASVIKVLAAAKADPNDCDHRERWTCLIWAADNAHADCVKVLLECDADVNKKDRRGQTPVDWCKECERPGQKECLAILQSFGGKSCEELSENQNEESCEELSENQNEESCEELSENQNEDESDESDDVE